MEPWRYRSKARIVACVDLLCTGIWLLLTCLYFMGGILFTVIRCYGPGTREDILLDLNTYGYRTYDPDFANADNLFNIAIFFFVVWLISTIFVIVKFVAIVKLMNATEIGIIDPVGAARRARFWRTVTIIFSVLSTMGGLILTIVAVFMLAPVLASLLFNLIGIYIVNNFILEVDRTLAKVEAKSRNKNKTSHPPHPMPRAEPKIYPLMPPSYVEVVEKI